MKQRQVRVRRTPPWTVVMLMRTLAWMKVVHARSLLLAVGAEDDDARLSRALRMPAAPMRLPTTQYRQTAKTMSPKSPPSRLQLRRQLKRLLPPPPLLWPHRRATPEGPAILGIEVAIVVVAVNKEALPGIGSSRPLQIC